MKAQEKREMERMEGKESRRREIIQAAKRLFFQKGVVESNMADIAKEAEISRFTLYRYFNNKYELLIEVQLLLFEENNPFQEVDGEELEKGVDQVRYTLHRVADYLYNAPDLVRFNTSFNQLFSNHEIPEELQERFRKMASEQRAALNRKGLTYLIRKGIDDGSIKGDIDPKETTILIMETIWGLVGKLLTSQNHPLGNSFDRQPLIHKLVDILVDHYKA